MKVKTKINLFICLLLTVMCVSCSKDSDNSEKKERTLWLWGYTVSYPTAKKEVALVDFLFFPADNNEKYLISNAKTESKDYIKYAEMAEDETYKLLMDQKMIKTTDGKLVSPVASFRSSITSEKEAVLPVGRYFVVALYYAKGNVLVGKHYWNKYATRDFVLEPGDAPKVLNVVIPADLTQYGAIPWINWVDKPYEF